MVVETQDQTSLRRIAEGARDRREARRRMLRAKLAYKVAKEEYEKAVEEAESIVDHETEELPLFPLLQAPAEGPGAGSGATAAPAGESRWLSQVADFPMEVTVSLGMLDVQTVADLGAWLARGNRVEDLPDVKRALAVRAINALAAFLKTRGQGAA